MTLNKCVLCDGVIENPKRPRYKGKPICQACFDLTKEDRISGVEI